MFFILKNFKKIKTKVKSIIKVKPKICQFLNLKYTKTIGSLIPKTISTKLKLFFFNFKNFQITKIKGY